MIPRQMILDILDLLRTGDITFVQAGDLVQQRALFERFRTAIEQTFAGFHVLISAGRVFVGSDFNEISKLAMRATGRVYYWEQIPPR